MQQGMEQGLGFSMELGGCMWASGFFEWLNRASVVKWRKNEPLLGPMLIQQGKFFCIQYFLLAVLEIIGFLPNWSCIQRFCHCKCVRQGMKKKSKLHWLYLSTLSLCVMRNHTQRREVRDSRPHSAPAVQRQYAEEQWSGAVYLETVSQGCGILDMCP